MDGLCYRLQASCHFMPKILTEAQVAAYRRDGFLLPLTAFAPDTAGRYRAHLEALEARIGTPLSGSLTPSKRKYRARTYLLCRWAYELASHPAILDAVQDVIGPDILVFTAPGSSRSRARRTSPAGTRTPPTSGSRRTTARHRLARAVRRFAGSGCMQFMPGSHRRGQLTHT